MSVDMIIEKIKQRDNNPMVLGLDPKIDYVPSHIKKINQEKYGLGLKFVAKCLLDFNKGLIDSMYDFVPIVKIQSAYYEMYGPDGISALIETAKYAKSKDMYIIIDAKRNDINETCQAYASAYLGKSKITNELNLVAFDADSMTINPYLGSDGILPFVDKCKDNGKSIFILVKTSNKSSFEIQDLVCSGEYVYEKIAFFVSNWGGATIGKNGYSNVGAVVGATHPKVFKKLRKIIKKAYFLVPGYGTQGGGIKDVVDAFNEDGLGCIISASRSIMCAYMENGDYRIESRRSALKIKQDIKKTILV